MTEPPYDNRGTFGFQAPTGADEPGKGYPFNLSNDAGILENGYRPQIVSRNLEYVPALYQTINLDTEDPLAHYDTFTEETVLPYDPNEPTYYKPILFYNQGIVDVVGTGYHGSNPLRCNFMGEVTYVDMPEYDSTDEYQPIAYISIKNIYTYQDTSGGWPLDEWVVSLNDAVVRNNFVQNENVRSKNAIGHYGSATFTWPIIYSSDDPPNPVIEEYFSDEYRSSLATYTYDGRFDIVPDDQRNRPWTDVKVGVSHLLTYVYVYTYDIQGSPGNPPTEITISQQEIDHTYTFQSEDYINQQDGYNRVFIGETFYNSSESYYIQIEDGSWALNETFITYANLGDSTDFNWDYDANNFNPNSPYYPQHPTISRGVYYKDPNYNPEDGDAFYTSDKFSYPDPKGFYSPPND
jgi:hypothetical protein